MISADGSYVDNEQNVRDIYCIDYVSRLYDIINLLKV